MAPLMDALSNHPSYIRGGFHCSLDHIEGCDVNKSLLRGEVPTYIAEDAKEDDTLYVMGYLSSIQRVFGPLVWQQILNNQTRKQGGNQC